MSRITHNAVPISMAAMLVSVMTVFPRYAGNGGGGVVLHLHVVGTVTQISEWLI